MKRAVVAASTFLTLLFGGWSEVHAQQKTLSGRWSATSMSVQWSIGDWGEACGPKPGGGGAPAGTVTVSQKGSELYISGAGRSWNTTQCWEQHPGMSVSHSGGSRGWKTVCKTAAGDPRQATIITSTNASDDFIGLNETGQYQFVIKGQNCTASVRRTRTFKLIQREGEAPPAPVTPPPAVTETKPAPPPTTETHARCNDLGPPARLEVRPSRKLMRPGEEFEFRAKVLDAAGCTLPTAPTWKVVGDRPGVALDGGKVKVAGDAPEAEVQISASVRGRSVEVTVEVASRERYDALLRGGGFNESGESEDAVVTAIASGSIGSGTAAVEDGSQGRRRTFVAVVGGLALLLGIVGLVLVMRGRKKKKSALPTVTATDPGPAVRPVVTTSGVLVCPTCREEYPLDAQFCPTDGNRLVRLDGADTRVPAGGICPVCGQGFDPGVVTCPTHDEELLPPAAYFAMRDSQPAIEKKICPVCGTQYSGQSGFCGTDGAALVPVN